nr:MAG TPA: hypothetical protein [Caudoviricetes sp.]
MNGRMGFPARLCYFFTFRFLSSGTIFHCISPYVRHIIRTDVLF